MKRRVFNLLPLAFGTVLLPGCGGGGGGLGGGLADIGSGGTGISPGDGGVGSGGTGILAYGIGVIEGFGSIIVNGIRYDTDRARLELEDADELKLGMTVRITGTVDPDAATGVASLVRSAADARGPASAIDVAAGRLRVASVQVAVDDATVYGGGLASLAHVRTGDVIQVHGLPQADGRMHASRLERVASTATVVLTGVVGALDALARTLDLEGLLVRLAAMADIPAGLMPGATVRIRGTLAGDELQGATLESWYPVEAREGTLLSLAGELRSAGGVLRLDGIAVDVSRTQVSGGPAREVVAGAQVEVTGTMRDGVLVASRVRLRRRATAAGGGGAGNSGGGGDGAGAGGNSGDSGNAGSSSSPDRPATTYSASGTIAAVRGLDEFRIRGQRIDASGPGVVFVNGSAADVRAGRKAVVTGSHVVDDVLVAQRVEFTDGS